jgi:hypothetical protein
MIGVFVPWSDSPHSTHGTAGYVVDGNGCHVWVGGRNQAGYGVAWDPIARRLRGAHRIRYERERGPVPAGLELDHFVCANKACCNPAHVRPVTRRENTLRSESVAAAHAAKTHCLRGHELSGANLISANLRRGERACRECHAIRNRTAEARAKRNARLRAKRKSLAG